MRRDSALEDELLHRCRSAGRPRVRDPHPRDHAYSFRQLFANAAIAASHVASGECGHRALGKSYLPAVLDDAGALPVG